MKFFYFVICFMCVNFLEAVCLSERTYRAGVLHLGRELPIKDDESVIYEAGKMHVDILVLPSYSAKDSGNYDEIVSFLSKMAKQAGLYIVTHLYESVKCHHNDEIVRNNIVFDRKGSVVSVYRNPVSNFANCSSSPSELVEFTTDFGITFGSLMMEDIILHDVQYMKGLKNFVMTGADAEAGVLDAAQFSSSWSYVNDVVLISESGIHTGKGGSKSSGRLTVTDIQSGLGSKPVVPSVPVINPSQVPSQYIFRPLNLEASSQGYTETVCHNNLCCEFYVKTKNTGPTDVSYGLAAFDDVRPISRYNIGVQNCAVFACASLYKRSCNLGPYNNTNVYFEKISITGNFTKQKAQYPIIHSTSMLPTENFKFDSNLGSQSTRVALEIVDGQNILKLGIFGRDFSKDSESIFTQSNSESTYDIYELIFNDDVQEFVDYVWIRIRILIVVVSIYVLEMM